MHVGFNFRHLRGVTFERFQSIWDDLGSFLESVFEVFSFIVVAIVVCIVIAAVIVIFFWEKPSQPLNSMRYELQLTIQIA